MPSEVEGDSGNGVSGAGGVETIAGAGERLGAAGFFAAGLFFAATFLAGFFATFFATFLAAFLAAFLTTFLAAFFAAFFGFAFPFLAAFFFLAMGRKIFVFMVFDDFHLLGMKAS
ncbi:MAG TPA: hypothetical protein VK508_07065 [Cyclobacteriaceae bacterium]|nr:hypothetical protein [Cyclobacteriaceae bacterium]